MFFRQYSYCAAYLFCLMLFSYSIAVYAFQRDIDSQLDEIKKSEDITSALYQLTQLENDELFTPIEKSKILHAKGILFYFNDRFDDAIKAFESAQKFSNTNKLLKPEALAYKYMGIIQYFKGNNQKALYAYQQSLNYFTEVKTPIQHANLLNNIGLVYAAMGDSLSALNQYKKAELIYLSKGSIEDQVDIRGNIAELYLRLKLHDVAITLLHEVLVQKETLKDDDGIAITHADLGVAYKYAKHHKKALHYTNKALDYYQKLNKNYHIASQFHNLSDLHNRLLEPNLAINYAKKALSLAKLSDNKNAEVGALYTLAVGLFHLGNVDESLKQLALSHQNALKMNYQQQINRNLTLYSLIYASQKNNKKALSIQQNYISALYKDSNNQINKHLVRYESERLKEKVKDLEQTNKLQELEREKMNQERNFIIVIVIFIFISAFYFYRRTNDIRSKDELAEKIKVRTIELEKLTEELQLANKVKSQFLANMSHEIRTPLTAVIGQSEAILSGEIDKEYLSKEVEIIHSNSLHVLDLINSILDLSKIEANKLELDLHHQDLHGVFIELNNIFSEQAKIKDLTFSVTHRLPVPFIMKFDAFRLKQILINLCANAIKFTQYGSVELNVYVLNKQLVFKVTDTGIGMSDTQIQDIFKSFTQGDSSISRRFGGSGLGLSLSKQLVNMMNGEIKVESELNVGSAFSLILPCDYSLGVNNNFKITKVVDKAIINNDIKCKGLIILADDYQDNLRIIARILTSMGLEVLTAVNGREAVELYDNNKPSLILLDIQMPEMDGIEAYDILRQKGCEAPIIALTANAMSHEIDEYLALGFDGHLKKPIERQLFINTIVKYCCESQLTEVQEEHISNIDTSDLVEQFRSNLVLEQQDLILHLKNNNNEKLAQLAHRIAGAGQMFGFPELSEKAIAVEYAIKHNHPDIHDFTQYLLNEIDTVLW